jgi:hypothetical protein
MISGRSANVAGPSWVKDVNECFAEYVRELEGQRTMPCSHLSYSVPSDNKKNVGGTSNTPSATHTERAGRSLLQRSPEGDHGTKEGCGQIAQKRRQDNGEHNVLYLIVDVE